MTRGLLGIGAVVFVLAVVAFGVARSEPRPSYPKAEAVRATLRSKEIRTRLTGRGWNEVRVIALDRDHWRVTFFDGPRQVLDAALDERGRVDAVEDHRPNVHPPGAMALWHPAVLVLFTCIFVLAVAVAPFRSARNLDALVIAGAVTLSAFFLDDRLVGAHVYAGTVALAFIAVRCATVAFASAEAEERPAPLEQYIPMIGWGVLIAAVILVVTSTGISDVAFAGLAGGTLLNHGVSPYGNIPIEVVHGDTYPLLTYVLYMPFAAISPVDDSFDSLDASLWLNAIALIAAAAILNRWGRRTALAWLAFPPVLLAASGGGNDVPTAALAAAGLAVYGRERLGAALYAMAGWVKIAPATALLPLLARLRGARLVQSVALVGGLLAAGLVAILALGGVDAIDAARRGLRFQFERGSWFSLWRQLDAPALQVACQALTVAFAVVATIFAARNPGLPIRRYAALVGTLLALIQLSANYWTYAYLPWLVPFILVALFPPTRPRSPQSEPRAP